MDVTERRNRASGEAADWWALLQGDDMSRAEREAFIDWLRDSQSNVAEMLRLAQVHGALGQFRDWAEISTERAAGEGGGNVVALRSSSGYDRLPASGASRHESKSSPRRLRLIALAATLSTIGIITALWVVQFRGQSIATERGERRAVVLDDGSVVKVDPQTHLKVQFEGDVRRVRLTQGRAVFRVAKDANRPFLVDAGDTTVRAVGTTFGVEQRKSNVVVVTVSEGRVAVSSRGLEPESLSATPSSSILPQPSQRAGKKPLPSRQKTGAILLDANEQITVAAAGSVPPVRTVHSERELAWADGRLVFTKDPISKVIAEFNRYNHVQLIVPDAALAARPVTGVFDAENPDAFIAFVQNAAPVRIERDGERSIVILPSAAQ